MGKSKKEEILDAEEVKPQKKAAKSKSKEVGTPATDAEAASKKTTKSSKKTDTPLVEVLNAGGSAIEDINQDLTSNFNHAAGTVQAETAAAIDEYDGPRYSDEDLEQFREKIMEFRHEALDELRMLRERLDDYTNYDFAEESMIYSMHMAEQGPEALEQEKTYAQVQRIGEYIKKLDEALVRIKDKTYGICRVCKCLIAKERLLAVPITTLSASYKIHKKCPDDGIDKIESLKK
ncbi:MAG: hypothetical protein PHV24_04500 [Candidatus Kapabacteria bacterium]|nr:hypothetical protein [Candidatus Kapabacteria bacterium]